MISSRDLIQGETLKDVKYNVQKVETDTQVLNLNFNGLGLVKLPSFEFKKGEVVDGLLKLPAKDIEVPLLVLATKKNIIHCQYYKNAQSVKTYLKSHYSPELAALGLKRLPSKDLKPQPDGTPNWYYDGYDCELYFIENEGCLIRFRIAFLGIYLESQIPGTPRYAHYETNTISGTGMSGSKIVNNKTHINIKEQETLLKFISYIKDLDADFREIIIKQIEKIPLV